VLCITSDGKYVKAAEAYNAQLGPGTADDDRANETANETKETWP
jgi:hypothetical protein